MQSLLDKHTPQIEDFLTGSVKTLGWGVLNWCSIYLVIPDGPNVGDPWVFSTEQALFILRYYAIDDNGRFIYNRAILERPKGWGKSPLLAAMCCVELLGPVRFSHFTDSGFPVGKPQGTPLIQIAAISEDQANNTYDLVMEMLKQGLAFEEYELQGCIMFSKVQTHSGGKIQKVTASPRGREGQRVTFVVCDETHLWVPAEKGPELFAAIKRNAAKMDNRVVETTNAPVPGEDSVAEVSYNSVLKKLEEAEEGGHKFINILLDTREVFIEDIYDRDQAFPALEYVYGDSMLTRGGWINLERLWDEMNDLSMPEQEARRFYFNQKVTGHTTWLNPKQWADVFDKDIKLKKDDPIALGFRVIPRNGAACIIAVRLTDGAIFNLSKPNWEKPDDAHDKWEVPHAEIDARLKNIVDKYNVHKILADPQNYQDVVGRWSIYFGENEAGKPLVEEFWTANNKTKMGRACEQFEEAVIASRISWNDSQLNRHVLSCHTEEVPGDLKIIRKETRHSKRYIVAAQAAVLALEAAVIAVEEGALEDRGTGELHTF